MKMFWGPHGRAFTHSLAIPMSEGWSLGWEKCIRGAGRAAVCAPAARGRGRGRESGAGRGGRQRSGEGEGSSERQHRRWYCTAGWGASKSVAYALLGGGRSSRLTGRRSGERGSRHFREIEEKSPGYLVFVSATLLICLPFKKLSEWNEDHKPRVKRAPYKKGGKDFFL